MNLMNVYLAVMLKCVTSEYEVFADLQFPFFSTLWHIIDISLIIHSSSFLSWFH